MITIDSIRNGVNNILLVDYPYPEKFTTSILTMKLSLLTGLLLTSTTLIIVQDTSAVSTQPFRGVPNPEEYVNTLTGTQSR